MIALLIANPIQFIFELLSIYLIKISFDDQKVGDNCKILSFQLFITFFYLYVFAQTVHDCILISSYGRLGMIFSTFVYCLMVD